MNEQMLLVEDDRHREVMVGVAHDPRTPLTVLHDNHESLATSDAGPA